MCKFLLRFQTLFQKVDEKYKCGGTIGHEDLYLEFLFRHFKVFRLQVKLHDAAGAEQMRKGKDPGYCYTIGRGPN